MEIKIHKSQRKQKLLELLKELLFSNSRNPIFQIIPTMELVNWRNSVLVRSILIKLIQARIVKHPLIKIKEQRVKHTKDRLVISHNKPQPRMLSTTLLTEELVFK